jgi:hypothetical protein
MDGLNVVNVIVFFTFVICVVTLVIYYSNPEKFEPAFRKAGPAGLKKPLFLTSLWGGVFLGLLVFLTEGWNCR